MSLSPIAVEALRAAQSAFSTAEADVFEDALARGLEVVDREGRIVGAYQAQELKRLTARVAELESQIEALSSQGRVLRSRPADGITRLQAPVQALREPEGEFFRFLHHDHLKGHDLELPEAGGSR